MRIAPKSRFWIVEVLVAVCLLLGLANLVKYGLLTADELVKHKNALDAANSAVGIAVLCIGAVLSYFRFFRGRTLSLRAELKLDVTVLEAPGEKYLHAVGIEMKNLGSVTIWNPTPTIDAYAYTGEKQRIHSSVEQWTEQRNQEDGVPVLDSGEASYFLSHQTFDRSIWAVTYVASVRCDDGTVWKRLITVENRPSKPKGKDTEGSDGNRDDGNHHGPSDSL